MTKLSNPPRIFKTQSDVVVPFSYPVSVEIGASLSKAPLYNVLKHSLKYLLNGLKHSQRACECAQVRQTHANNSLERFRSRASLAFKDVHISNTPSAHLF